MIALPKTFRFSLKTTAISFTLAAVMLICSKWQWNRYLYKVDLVDTYKQHSTSTPLSFPIQARTAKDFAPLLHKRVVFEGGYDYSRQMIVTNRKNAYGPGHWLLTPLKLKNSDQHLIISRGFIPYKDRDPAQWQKYNFAAQEKLHGVLQESKEARTFGPKNPKVGPDTGFAHTWFFPEIEKMSKQLPYPVITPVFVQLIGGPPEGKYPEEAISIRVPPSTHFGYMIEWIILAVVTLGIGFALQAFFLHRYESSNKSNA